LFARRIATYLPGPIGFNEFAEWLTGLTTQKEDVDFGKQVPPHRVFQLQCMVDSFMVARGWIVSHSGRDILVTAAQGFSATRDACRFTDMYSRRVEVLVNRLEGTVNPAIIELLGRLKTNFSGWLCGPNPHGNHTSRAGAYGSLFPHDEEPNALWDFSPYLCGAGLVESLGGPGIIRQCLVKDPLYLDNLRAPSAQEIDGAGGGGFVLETALWGEVLHVIRVLGGDREKAPNLGKLVEYRRCVYLACRSPVVSKG
jgi:hypothetical protein